MFFRANKDSEIRKASVMVDKDPGATGMQQNPSLLSNQQQQQQENINNDGPPSLPPRKKWVFTSHEEGNDEGAPAPIEKDNNGLNGSQNGETGGLTIHAIEADQRNRILKKYPSLSIMSSSNWTMQSVEAVNETEKRQSVGSVISYANCEKRSKIPPSTSASSVDYPSNSLPRVNVAKFRQNSVSPDATSKKAPVLKAATLSDQTLRDGYAISSTLPQNVQLEKQGEMETFLSPKSAQIESNQQQPRVSYPAGSPSGAAGPHTQSESAPRFIPMYEDRASVGYNSGIQDPSVLNVVRPSLNSAMLPPGTIAYSSNRPVLVAASNPLYFNQFQGPVPTPPQIHMRPAWIPRAPDRGRPLARPNGAFMSKNPPNFRPQHMPQPNPQRPFIVPRPFGPQSESQKSLQVHEPLQYQQPVQQQSQKIVQQQQPQMSQPFRIPRPFDSKPSLLKQARPSALPHGHQAPVQQQITTQMYHQYPQHPVFPMNGGSARPIPSPAQRPSLHLNQAPTLQTSLLQQQEHQTQNLQYDPHLEVFAPSEQPPSPKRKAPESLDSTSDSSVGKNDKGGSPSKELKIDKLDMNSTVKQEEAQRIPDNSTSNIRASLSGSFRENSINVIQPSPTASPVAPVRRSYESGSVAEKVNFDRRNSLDDKSLSLKVESDRRLSVIDDAASEYTESDAGSSRSSSIYSHVSGRLSDVRPSFVTLARRRNEILLSQQLTHQNLVRIMEEHKLEAQNNPKDPKSLFEYAKACLAAGEPHIDEGFILLKKVASNGYPEAHFFLGEAYADDGKDSLAYSQFLSAAKRGYAPACHAIGKCAEIGKGCKKNLRLALEMYTKAATAGSLESMYRLGCAEMKSELRLKGDPVKATKWFKRAAAVPNRKHPEPLYELANIYETGIPPYIIQDFAYARGVLQEAVDFGYPPAIYKLGYSLEHGLLGYDVNPPESMRLYTLAMNLGHIEAYLGMAGWHMTGVDNFLPKDQEMAFKLVKEAADRGLARAQYTLGYFYEGGIGVPADSEQAFTYYELAADQGEERAQTRLEKATVPRRSTRQKEKKKNSFFSGFFK